MYYVVRTNGLKHIGRSEIIIKPLTVLLGKSWKSKSMIIRTLWLALRTLNPLYVSLFSGVRARNEEDYLRSAERMINTVGPEIIKGFPISIIDKESLTARIMVEANDVYSEVVVDPEGASLRLNISNKMLDTFINATERNIGSRVWLRSNLLELFDPLLLGYERILLGNLINTLGEALGFSHRIINEQRYVIEALLQEHSKIQDEWLKKLLNSLELNSLWKGGVIDSNYNEMLSWNNISCPVASILSLSLSLLTYFPKVLLVESPELCLHPEQVLRLVQFTVVKVKEYNKFMILSTNSDYFLFKINNLILLYLRGNYVSYNEEAQALDPNIVAVYSIKGKDLIESVSLNRGFNEDEFRGVSEEIYRERTRILREIELGSQRFGI